MKKISSFLDTTYTKILLTATCVALIAILFMQKQSRKRIEEVSKLPFYNISLEDVDDGNYSYRTETSFYIVEVEVSVENHQLKNITVIDNSGSAGKKIDTLIENMIKSNSFNIPVIEGDELGGIVLISCVNSALHNGLTTSSELNNGDEEFSN